MFTMDLAMAPPSTAMYWPASHRVSSGVSSGARSVDTEVMATERAVSARAR